MMTNNRTVSAQEYVKSWAAEHGHAGKCDAHLTPTIDHKIVITAVNSEDWLELPGGNSDQPISKTEREQIADWLNARRL